MRQTLRGHGGCGLQVGSRGLAPIVPVGSGTCLHLAPNPFSNMERGSLKDTLWLIKRRIGAKSECLSEKAMAPHSSTFAWKILWMEKPGRLQSMGSLRVGYD